MSRQAVLERLADSIPLIAPSMLKCDFGNLHREIELLESADTRMLHLDVMDGHFVPNLTYGPLVIERLRELTELPFEAHLMISDPARYADDYLKAGCNLLTFHLEAVPEPRPLIEQIHAKGAAAGLAINPKTPVESLAPFLEAVDLVLVMSVEPGFGGQKFIPSALEKLRWLRSRLPRKTLLSVDGGIEHATIAETAQAGATVFVVGSAIFDPPSFEGGDYGAAIQELTEQARNHLAPF
ncbi:MAG TPA: ribulose-phosphate 3-epimerase [Planctomycetaceae bacterium]|jgi:ribulose-phosphate 3-epimerase|nr:ribulose-phosphate 3-epimerase [Planctomycetaceae bacterium]